MPRYVVHCGDVRQTFAYGSKWTDTALRKKLAELLQRVEVAPGLILQDEAGKLWKLKVILELEPG